MVRCAGMGMRN